MLAINTAANVQRTSSSSSTTATPTAPTTSIVSTTTTTTPCSSSTSTTSGSTTGPTTPPSVVTTGYNTKDDDDEDDSQIIQMIDNCFQIFDSIGKTIKNSPRAGGYVSVEFIGHKSFRFSFRVGAASWRIYATITLNCKWKINLKIFEFFFGKLGGQFGIHMIIS